MEVTELEKLEYEAWVKELYEKGYRYIIKMTDENNVSYIMSDNPCGWRETKDCVGFYDKSDGIRHFKYDDAVERVEFEQKYNPKCIFQVKEISFNKK